MNNNVSLAQHKEWVLSKNEKREAGLLDICLFLLVYTYFLLFTTNLYEFSPDDAKHKIMLAGWK